MIDWPDVTGLVKVVRPLTNHGGHFLVETTDVLQYYLPQTTWRQWSNTLDDSPAYYQREIARHYFSVVVLSFDQTLAADYSIAFDLSQTSGYRLAARCAREARSSTSGSTRAGCEAGLPTVPTSMYSHLVETREVLIESTRELLWERGYVGTSPKAIQRRSGAGQGSMYHHFAGSATWRLPPSSATRRTWSPGPTTISAGPVASLSGSPGTCAASGRRCAAARWDGSPMDPEVMADKELRRPVERAFAAVRERLAAVIDEGRQNGELGPSVDPAAVATALVAVLQGGYVLARAADSADTYAQAVGRTRAACRLLNVDRAQIARPGADNSRTDKW